MHNECPLRYNCFFAAPMVKWKMPEKMDKITYLLKKKQEKKKRRKRGKPKKTIFIVELRNRKKRVPRVGTHY